MIFVTVGSQDKGFDRLIKAIDKAIAKGQIKEPVTAQIGQGHYKPQNMTYFDFASNDEIAKHMDDSSLIITHGGVGSIVEGLKKGKKILAAPRLKEFAEVANDHQVQIISALEQENVIMSVIDFDTIGQKVAQAQRKEFAEYQFNNAHFVRQIEAEIDQLLKSED